MQARRISVVGNSGSGKTTVAADLARRLAIPHFELDAIFHQPHWTTPDEEEFRARVDALTGQPAWVVDGNYSAVRELVWQRAQAVVWLDLPRHVVLPAIVRRSLRRAVTREKLWAGNRERLGDLVRLHDPERSIIAWSWTKHAVYHRTYGAAQVDAAWAHLEWVRLTSRRTLRRWLDAVHA